MANVTEEEFQRIMANAGKKARKPSKMGNRWIAIDGIKFQSEKEGERYLILKRRRDAGEIKDLVLQPEYALVVNGHRICKYRADFRYQEDGASIVEDVKGRRSGPAFAHFRDKAKLFAALFGQEIQLWPVVTKKPRRPRIKGTTK